MGRTKSTPGRPLVFCAINSVMVQGHTVCPTVCGIRRRHVLSQTARKQSAATMVPINDDQSVIPCITLSFVCVPWEMITCFIIGRYVRRSKLAAFLKWINMATYINNASKPIGRRLSYPPLTLQNWQGMAISQIDCRWDVVIVAPTGSGKCMVFHGLALKNDRNVEFVIAPINALMSNQVGNWSLKRDTYRRGRKLMLL